MKIVKIISVAAIVLGCLQSCSSSAPVYVMIPAPASVVQESGTNFTINKQTKIMYDERNEELKAKAFFLSEWIKEHSGFVLSMHAFERSRNTNAIVLKHNPQKRKEGFHLKVNDDGIEIESADGAGAFYAIQTLRKSMLLQSKGSLSFAPISIDDYPATDYRGAMLDVSRNFFTVQQVKSFLDLMALHQLNYFHWHLTDDQGWRIEIKKYPELTRIGAWRGEGKEKIGGYYSQEEIKEIVAYATQRCIRVIPEIDFPGHSSAALAAYPQLGCTGGPYHVATESGGVHSDVLCLGSDFAHLFVKDVLSEVATLFPAPYFHIGGDEVPRKRWQACAKCQAEISRHKLKDNGNQSAEDLLQGVFNAQLAEYLQGMGKQMIGWDEVLTDNILPETIIMSWRGLGKGIHAVCQGHSVILSSNGQLYFNNYQAKEIEGEPMATGGLVQMQSVYEAPLQPKELTDTEKQKIMGAQACLWTSHVSDDATLQYMMLPRLAAFSEAVWSGERKGTYADFLNRLPLLLNCYKQLNYQYASHFFEIKPVYTPNTQQKQLEVTLESLPDASIYYTLDGQEPSTKSTKYVEPISIHKTATLRAVAYLSNGLRSDVLKKEVVVNKATFADVTLLTKPATRYEGNGGNVLVDGVRSDKFATSGLWIGYNPQNLEAVIDLGRVQAISELRISSLVDLSAWIMGIESIVVSLSDDDQQFTIVAEQQNEEPKEDLMGKKVEQLKLSFPSQEARYVKVLARRFNGLPSYHSGAGEPPFLFVDEIEIYE